MLSDIRRLCATFIRSDDLVPGVCAVLRDCKVPS